MKNRSQLHYNLAPVLYILNIELVKTNYRDIILNKTIKLSSIFWWKIDASMRTTCKISVTTKVRLPVCIMKANSSIEWHPDVYKRQGLGCLQYFMELLKLHIPIFADIEESWSYIPIFLNCLYS